MSQSILQVANGKATTIKKTFSRQTSVQTTIKADRAVIWLLLTDASNYPKWNSTIVSIDGKIALGAILYVRKNWRTSFSIVRKTDTALR